MQTEYWWVGDQTMRALLTLILVFLTGTAYGQKEFNKNSLPFQISNFDGPIKLLLSSSVKSSCINKIETDDPNSKALVESLSNTMKKFDIDITKSFLGKRKLSIAMGNGGKAFKYLLDINADGSRVTFDQVQDEFGKRVSFKPSDLDSGGQIGFKYMTDALFNSYIGKNLHVNDLVDETILSESFCVTLNLNTSEAVTSHKVLGVTTYKDRATLVIGGSSNQTCGSGSDAFKLQMESWKLLDIKSGLLLNSNDKFSIKNNQHSFSFIESTECKISSENTLNDKTASSTPSISSLKSSKDSSSFDERKRLDEEKIRLLDERRRLEEDKRQREQAKANQRINFQVNNSQPNADGDVSINIETNADTASLKINGEEQGGRADGKYTLKRVARAGQETRFEIIAKDIYGNSDTKTIVVSRTVVESKVTYQQLNPDRIKRQPERDAVAVIIGISNYKSLPKAEFAKDDAQVFYDYAIRALGVKPGNIKLLMDEQADAEEIYTAFKTWLPARVKSTTDVYVFYSGHGLPTQDGSGLYWLPQRANRDLISKTGILLSEINSDIQATKPKSVTIFMDACYSGQARGGETLVASARPIALKSQSTTFPSNFTVISASQADQISSSSPELQHGIFSYYLMRGMEGEADLNRDGKITLDEIQSYLSENVGRQARIMNRQQEPQVIGDGSRVLVGR